MKSKEILSALICGAAMVDGLLAGQVKGRPSPSIQRGACGSWWSWLSRRRR